MSDTLVWVAGITQAITATVAVAALVVSIYGLRLQRQDKSPRLRVTGSVSTLLDSDFKPLEHVYMITAANRSTAPVTVTQLYLWHTPGWKIALAPVVRGGKPFPCNLDPWDSGSWWVEYEALRETLRQQGHRGKLRTRLEARDASGDAHFAHTKIILNAPGWRRVFGE